MLPMSKIGQRLTDGFRERNSSVLWRLYAPWRQGVAGTSPVNLLISHRDTYPP